MPTKTQVNKLFVEAAEYIKQDPEGAMELLAEVDPISWVQHIGLQTEKDEPIEFRNHAPLAQIYSDMHPDQVYQKGAQIGLTGTVVNKILWLGDHNNITVIYVFPTADDVYKFSKGRFGPVIKSNFYLRKRMRNADNAMQKQIGHSWIYFKGAQKETQAISIPADGLVIDEVDFCPPDILDVFTKRLTASKSPFVWRFSTPTIPGYGINALFDQTDQRHWLVRCDGCNRWQPIDFWKNVRKRKGVYRFVCYKCHRILRRRSGLWVAKYPQKATDTVYDDAGRVTEPATGLRGYFVNPLAFGFITADKKAKDWEKAQKSTRANAIKNFHNFDLGLPYVSGSSLITEETIRSSMRLDYNASGFNVFGCDQGDLLHWVVKHISPDGTKPIVAFGIVSTFEEAWTKFNQWYCKIGIIDALPNKHSARQLVQKSYKKLYMAYYKDQNEALRERVEDSREKSKERNPYSYSRRETQTLLLDRAETLDTSAKDWLEGRAFLAKSSEVITEEIWEFIRQMQAMKRDIKEDTKGNPRAVWVKTGPDHFRHADNFAAVAAELRTTGSSNQINVTGSIQDYIVDDGGEDLLPYESASTLAEFLRME
jgi:phage terminase large subunit GpA